LSMDVVSLPRLSIALVAGVLLVSFYGRSLWQVKTWTIGRLAFRTVVTAVIVYFLAGAAYSVYWVQPYEGPYVWVSWKHFLIALAISPVLVAAVAEWARVIQRSGPWTPMRALGLAGMTAVVVEMAYALVCFAYRAFP